MRRKTWCAALAALAILLLCVTGCGSQAEDGRTHITYAIWDKNQQPAMEAIAALHVDGL